MRKELLRVTVVGAAAMCTAALVVVRHRIKNSSKWAKAMSRFKELAEKCETPLGKLRQFTYAMTVEMHAGLASEGGSKLKMIDSNVDKIPTGDEKVLSYAPDLGGTNFRGLREKLGGKDSGVAQREFKEESIPPELMVGSSEQLCDSRAEALAKFVATESEGLHAEPDKLRELGLTFSLQTLIRWTKDFKIEDAVGKDVVAELTKAIKKKGIDMHVTALVINMEWGNFRSSHPPVTEYDVVLDEESLNPGEKVINMEWGNFRSSHLPVTEYDVVLDEESLNPGEQVINMEWGNFRSSHLPVTEYDVALDEESLNPGEQVINMERGNFLNLEWGNFRSSHLPVTGYDVALDEESLNPGEQETMAIGDQKIRENYF